MFNRLLAACAALAVSCGTHAASCFAYAPAPTSPPAGVNVVYVHDHGIDPGDEYNDAANIQALLDNTTVVPSGTWVVFDAGTYLQEKSIKVTRDDITLLGQGTTLRATDPYSMAIHVNGNNTQIFGFTLTARGAVTRNGDSILHSRIALQRNPGTGRIPITGVKIQGNSIQEDLTLTDAVNSSTAAGILVTEGHDFLITDNYISRTLSDGIHISTKSTRGMVLNNTIISTGDDGVGVTSTLDGDVAETNTADGLLEAIQEGRGLNTHILIAGNNISNNYWGRGVGIAGGKNITVRSNTISGTPESAAIFVGRDHSKTTWGIENVVVEGNVISNIQIACPSFNWGNKCTNATSDWGVIESYSMLWADEPDELPNLDDKQQLFVRNLAIRKNTINNAHATAVRLAGANPSATSVRGQVYGAVSQVNVLKNALTDVDSPYLSFSNQGTDTGSIVSTMFCIENTYSTGGSAPATPSNQAACTRATPTTIVGAQLDCTVPPLP